jgi:hypothetical protein
MSVTIDPMAQREIGPILDSRESLLWAGKPRQGLVLRRSDAFMIPFSLMWGGFAIFWEATVLSQDAPGFFALWGIPFVVMGLYFIFGRFFVDAMNRAKTVYGLTDRRVIIVSGIFSRTTNSLPLRTLSDVSLEERKDRSGSVYFGRQPIGNWAAGMQWPGMSQNSPPVFEFISEAKDVHDRVLEAQRAAA